MTSPSCKSIIILAKTKQNMHEVCTFVFHIIKLDKQITLYQILKATNHFVNRCKAFCIFACLMKGIKDSDAN